VGRGGGLYPKWQSGQTEWLMFTCYKADVKNERSSTSTATRLLALYFTVIS
jgi:hypothetical protein